MILSSNRIDYKYIGKTRNKYIYKSILLFSVIYSYLVFCLQFLEKNNEHYIYLYLTNWTFTIFLLSSTLQLLESLIDPRTFVYWLKNIIFISGLIIKPTYIYVFIFYCFGLILKALGFDDLILQKSQDKTWLFYFNDISKHFVFVFLLIILFILQPRVYNEFLFKWWKFMYSFFFILNYLMFVLLYYIITDIKIYNLDDIFIICLIITLPVFIFLIHFGFYIEDCKIRKSLFNS